MKSSGFSNARLLLLSFAAFVVLVALAWWAAHVFGQALNGMR